MTSSYIATLERVVLAEAEAARADASLSNLSTRVAAIIGNGTSTRIPDLQRSLGADPRAIGAVLRKLGFRRRRMWRGDDYALTCWQRASWSTPLSR